ncbi:MAG: TspO/MBR family protein [Candidatus Woesearchaeota archaeon]
MINKKFLRLGKLFVSIFISLLAGFIGSFFTTSSVSNWYPTLTKPFFNPPNWIFAPVWTILYILIGISLFLVWDKISSNLFSEKAIILFIIQLILNSLWSILFFGLRSPLLGVVGIIPLWITILLMMYYFRKESKLSFYLLIPYILWVSFAAILNIAIFVLN